MARVIGARVVEGMAVTSEEQDHDAPATDAAAHPPSDFEAFYRSESGRVLGVVTALTGDRAVAEDLTQEAFAAAYRTWPRISTYDRPGSWVRRVAVNRAVSSLRTRQAEGRALQRVRSLPDPSVPTEPLVDDELWQAIRSLPAKQAQAIALTYVEDLPPARVAEVLGCSEGAVKSHLNRARRTLAQRLAPLDPPHGSDAP